MGASYNIEKVRSGTYPIFLHVTSNFITRYHMHLGRHLYFLIKTASDSSTGEPQHATNGIAVRCHFS